MSRNNVLNSIGIVAVFLGVLLLAQRAEAQIVLRAPLKIPLLTAHLRKYRHSPLTEIAA